MILLIVLFISSLLWADEINKGTDYQFSLNLLKTGTTKYDFCTKESITGTGGIVDITEIEFPLGTNKKEVKTDFGFYWDLFSGESDVYITISAEFSALLDGSMNCMLYNNDLTNPMYLNYSVAASIYEGYGPGGKIEGSDVSLTVSNEMINSNQFTDRSITLLDNHHLDAFSNYKGGAAVDLTLTAPTNENGEHSFSGGGVYTGYVIVKVDAN